MIKNVKERIILKKPYESYVGYLNHTLIPAKNYKYTAIDLFAGCGGLSLGFEAAGIKTIGYDMDRDCCETYRQYGRKCFHEKLSMTTQFQKADIVIGGPPCQPFSVQGKQQGREDERNGFPIFISAIQTIEPNIFLFENVRGLLYKNRDYFENVISQLQALGYIVVFRLVNAANYDVPQNRERVICVGTRDRAFEFPKENEYLVTSGEAIQDLIPKSHDDELFLTPNMDEYIAKYEKKSHCVRSRDLHLDEPARTLTCRNLAGATSDMQRIRLNDGRRRLTIREAARLQSFPDLFTFCGTKNSQYKQIGNAVPPFLAYHLAKAIMKHVTNST